MSKETCGGKIVKEWPNFFLRDDSNMRRSIRLEPYEAYSLFCEILYHRVRVFVGPQDWAIQEAEKKINEYNSKENIS